MAGPYKSWEKIMSDGIRKRPGQSEYVPVYGNELRDEEFKLAPDKPIPDDQPPIGVAELKKRGLVAERKCVKWEWVIRKK